MQTAGYVLGTEGHWEASSYLTWHFHHAGSQDSSDIHHIGSKRLLLADEMASPPPNKAGAVNQVPSAADGLD